MCRIVFAVHPTMTVQEHAGNEKSCVWHATDFADGELKDELFCIRFGSIESMFVLSDNFILEMVYASYVVIVQLNCLVL